MKFLPAKKEPTAQPAEILMSGPKSKPEKSVPSFKTRASSFLYFAHLEFQHEVHTLLPKRVNVIKDQGNNNINAIGLVSGNTILDKKERQLK